MFDLQFLENNPSMPPFYATLITVLFAFFLSSLIAITYEYTTKSIYKRAHFLQSLAMIAVVAAMVMQAVGDSLARGLGMLGALAIIRFRTNLNDPRNITFMFASLAAGIACGVFGFSIAITGTLVFCASAILFRFSPLNNADELIGNLRLQLPKDDQQQPLIEQILRRYCQDYELDQLRYLNPKTVERVSAAGIPVTEEISREDLQEFTYSVRLKRDATATSLTTSLEQLAGLENLKLNFKKEPTVL
ncbi:MAG: DUF4956 domain-containing protein [Tunicatimonas sp.]